MNTTIYIKEWLRRVTLWIKSFGVAKQGDYASALYGATSSTPWTAPCNGILVIMSRTSNVDSYWKVFDITDNMNVACASKQGATIIEVCTSFPVIKGHQYYSIATGLTTPRTATLYRIGGNTFNI